MSRLVEVAYQLLLLLIAVPILLLLRMHYYASRRSRLLWSGRRPRPASSGNDKQHQLLPSPPGLPIIGHLHLVISKLSHVSLRDLSAKHGRDGLMLLHLGSVPTLIVSSPSAAEAIMRTYDHVFASRPASTLGDNLMYGSSDIAFSPYGEHWRQTRKLVAKHLLNVKKVHSNRHTRKEEVRLVMANIREAAAVGTSMDMGMVMNRFANDIISRTVLGKFCRVESRNRLLQELVETNSALVGGFNLEDYFPGLARSLDFLCRRFVRNRAYKTHKRWDELLQTILSDHEKRVDSMHRNNDGGDFTDVLLSVQKEYGMTRDHIKAILMDMFAAGTETTSVVLELAMAELMRKPHKMAKLQEEVRKHTPEGQEMVEEADLASMHFLRAVVKETLRLHPPAPLLLPHLSVADCVVGGYHVSSGTRVIVNVWALGLGETRSHGRSQRSSCRRGSWTVAMMHCVDFKGNHFQFLPFGAGRRMCPGLNFGMATVENMLANLVYCFDCQLPMGMEDKCVDMTEVFGLPVRLKEKLMLVPKLRGAAAAGRHSSLLRSMHAAEDMHRSSKYVLSHPHALISPSSIYIDPSIYRTRTQ